MTKKSKKVHLPTSSHDSAGEEQDLSGNERGCWYPHDTDSFHWVLSRYTKIAPDSILLLDHRYLDIRDISLVEQIESENEASKGTVGFKPVTDNEIIHRLELANDSNPNKDCKRWYTLLKDLQAAAGGKHSVRQINTKHINTRSRWSVPFKSLHEVGYLIKNQTQRGAKNRTSNQNTQVHTHRTNIEKKNLASIKALKKYMYHRQHVELYYPEKSYLNFTFAEPLVDSDNVDDV
ncbi:hypothetical protein H4R26_001977 [Coemansia thaxteri]|uniref:Uncharacterized protein n=1 Tax=Coemansia thaxteri TaxID=2663907 RepID=A0A9W8BLB6_9FUNG|nr:hypothetical protein H4R26_001977 [Coemansia thaxteri]